MEPDIQNQIEKRIAQLPEDIQQAILSSELDAHIQAVGQRHGLHIDQIGLLADETMLVMLGFMSAEQFSEQLQEQLKISLEQAEAIAAEIGNEVFMPIRESMKQFSAQKPAETPLSTQDAVQAPPIVPSASSPDAPAPKKPEEIHPADLLLAQKTISVPPIAAQTTSVPPKPSNYTADPYREPVE